MANRICRVWVRNTGSGTIEFVEKHLDHGDWIEDWQPWKTAAKIGPGEERRFESAESDDDIPIIGHYLTGNEGWVIYRTFMMPAGYGSAREVYIKLSWNLPRIPASDSGVYAPQITTYNPLTPAPTAGEFDDRDKTPFDTTGQYRMFTASDPAGDDWTEVFPPILATPIAWPLVLLAAKLGANVWFEFKNTVAPETTTYPPFTDGVKKKTVPQAMIFTDESNWQGEWSGKQMSVKIAPAEPGKLQIQVCDHSVSSEYGPTQIVTLNHLTPTAVIKEKISKTLTPKHYELTPEDLLIAQEETKSSKLAHEIMEPVGGVALAPEISLAKEVAKISHVEIDGDWVDLEQNAVLELSRMMAGSDWVDTAIRFRQPASSAFIALQDHVDEYLYYVPQVH